MTVTWHYQVTLFMSMGPMRHQLRKRILRKGEQQSAELLGDSSLGVYSHVEDVSQKFLQLPHLSE